MTQDPFKWAAELSNSAMYMTQGPADLATVRRALDSLRTRHPEGQVFAMVPAFLADIMRGHFPGVEIIEAPVIQCGPDEVSAMLFLQGGPFLVSDSVRGVSCIRDQTKVQEIVCPLVPRDLTYLLTIMGAEGVTLDSINQNRANGA